MSQLDGWEATASLPWGPVRAWDVSLVCSYRACRALVLSGGLWFSLGWCEEGRASKGDAWDVRLLQSP